MNSRAPSDAIRPATAVGSDLKLYRDKYTENEITLLLRTTRLAPRGLAVGWAGRGGELGVNRLIPGGLAIDSAPTGAGRSPQGEGCGLLGIGLCLHLWRQFVLGCLHAQLQLAL
jgi:hypothetical protein